MKIIDLENNDSDYTGNNFIALGNFDGIHIAHKSIIEKMVFESKRLGFNSSILIFKEHTLNYLNRDTLKVLTSLEDKLEILKDFNIDQVFLVNFEELKSLAPQEFIEDFLMDSLNIKGIFVGFDYKFGESAQGDTQFLKKYELEENLKIWVEDPILYKTMPISSSYIKHLVEKNDLKLAEKLLGRPYYLKGVVVTGKRLGSKLGFPTANIKLDANYVLPEEGVYDTEIIVGGVLYRAATSLGVNVTLGENTVKVEAHIINFNKEIYGHKVKIRFIEKLRDMTKFDNLDELKTQVIKDVMDVKKRLNIE